MTEEIDPEELVAEGYALANHGLTHLRKALEGKPVEFYTLSVWFHASSDWVRRTDAIQDSIPVIGEVTENLTWLNLRLSPPTITGPVRFVIDNSTD